MTVVPWMFDRARWPMTAALLDAWEDLETQHRYLERTNLGWARVCR